MSALSLVTPPVGTVVTLQEAKDHCRVTGADDDNVLNAYVTAATTYLDGRDGVLGRALFAQTWDLYLDQFPSDGGIYLPFPPLQAVSVITYTDTNAATQTVSAASYSVDALSQPGYVSPGDDGWPGDVATQINAVKVRFVAGYSTVPYPIKLAALLLIGHWFANREAVITGIIVADTPMGVDALLAPYTIHKLD